MPTIKVSHRFPYPAEQVYRLAKQVERFPQFMEDLDRVEVLERDESGPTLTRWSGRVKIASITRELVWTERDRWDDQEMSCSFAMEQGDLKSYHGVWRFKAEDGSCLSELEVEFELGIPMLGPLVEQLVADRLRENLNQLMQALEKLCEKELGQP